MKETIPLIFDPKHACFYEVAAFIVLRYIPCYVSLMAQKHVSIFS